MCFTKLITMKKSTRYIHWQSNRKRAKKPKRKTKTFVRRQLSAIQHGQIIAWKNMPKPLSNREIARKLGRSEGAVRLFLKKWQSTGSNKRKKGSGRTRKSTLRQDRAIFLAAKRNKFITLRSIKQEHELNMSEVTIGRRLREQGFVSKFSKKKPMMTKSHAKKRLEFAKKYLNKPASFWDNVLFADESAFGILYQGKRRAWVKKNQQHYTPTVKHPKKINLWGGFCYHGVTPLHMIDGNLDAKKLLNIFKRTLWPSSIGLFDSDDWLLFQDNDPKHNAMIVQNWLVEKCINLVACPPYSPDLNPIENLWAILDKKAKSRHLSTEEDLFKCLTEHWNKIENNTLKILARSMPRRLRACIDANGWATKY